ncbi:FAD-dependent catabolic D-arginine dehydrogenase DauA [soil metagenome]
MLSVDFIVIGAGIAGASVAAELAQRGQTVALIEAEERPGYHSTGRSAALFSEMYGNATIRALSRASRDTFLNPPPGFSSIELFRPRGALFIANVEQAGRLNDFAVLPDVACQTTLVTAEEAQSLCAILRDDYVVAGLYEPDAKDIEVDALQQGYLRVLKQHGGQLLTSTTAQSFERCEGMWRVTTNDGVIAARIVVNAAGAWADHIAKMAKAEPIGIMPYRRTAVLVDAPEGLAIEHWPLVIDIDEQFYFKPDAGLLLISPADETPTEPCDAQPEEWDIAVAVDKVMGAAALNVRQIRHKWAGLRSFVADRTPVVGFDGKTDGFFWLVGQGGYGVQTAPALAKLACALALGEDVPADIAGFGVRAADLSPARFGR